MKYHSTRNNKISMTSMEIIKQGLSSEGYLFGNIPKVSRRAENSDSVPAACQENFVHVFN